MTKHCCFHLFIYALTGLLFIGRCGTSFRHSFLYLQSASCIYVLCIDHRITAVSKLFCTVALPKWQQFDNRLLQITVFTSQQGHSMCVYFINTNGMDVIDIKVIIIQFHIFSSSVNTPLNTTVQIRTLLILQDFFSLQIHCKKKSVVFTK